MLSRCLFWFDMLINTIVSVVLHLTLLYYSATFKPIVSMIPTGVLEVDW